MTTDSAISLETASQLLGITGGSDALSDALTSKVIHPPRADPIKVQLNDEEAISSRDAFAKGTSVKSDEELMQNVVLLIIVSISLFCLFHSPLLFVFYCLLQLFKINTQNGIH